MGPPAQSRAFAGGIPAMNTSHDCWALVLAAGDGTRLSGLTTDANGRSVPKQFCSLAGNTSMLQDTLARAGRIAPPRRTVVVVARQHRSWWMDSLRDFAPDNVLVQPRNRGTGIGVLLPLLSILDRDPHANIVLLPSDHYVRNERVLRHSILQAVAQLSSREGGIVLLGITPDHFDAELGYIVPSGVPSGGVRPVRLFVEKPDPGLAPALLAQGAVWNSFIIAVRGQDLLNLYAERFPDVVMAMARAVRASRNGQDLALSSLYELLPAIDFSRHVIADATSRLRLVTVPYCGWSDLGTPARVAKCLKSIPRQRRGRAPAIEQPAAFLRLADVQPQLAG